VIQQWAKPGTFRQLSQQTGKLAVRQPIWHGISKGSQHAGWQIRRDWPYPQVGTKLPGELLYFTLLKHAILFRTRAHSTRPPAWLSNSSTLPQAKVKTKNAYSLRIKN